MQLIVHNIFKKNREYGEKDQKKYRFTVISSPWDGKAVEKKGWKKKVVVEISVVEIKKKKKIGFGKQKNLDLVSSSVGNSSFKNEMKSYFKLKFENLKYIWQITQPISGWGE